MNCTLTELFNDDVQVMSDQWTIDEQHLRVSNVDSVWLEFPPEKLECKFLNFRADLFNA